MLIISRKLSDRNGLAVVAALREARCHNRDMAVIVVSSHISAVPQHLRIQSLARRDKNLIPGLKQSIQGIRVRRSTAAHQN